MRIVLSLAAAALAFCLALSAPAEAFDDSLPSYAPYRRPFLLHSVYAPTRHRYRRHVLRHRPAHAYAVYCHRWTWREYCRPYRLGGYFARNYDFRRAPWYR